jgi:hypothetical protein
MISTETTVSIPSSSRTYYDNDDVDESEVVRIGYDSDGNGCETSVDQILDGIQHASSSNINAVVMYLYLGSDYTRQHFHPDDDRIQRALEWMIVSTHQDQGRRRLKRIVLEFSTPPGRAICLDSRDESNWYKLERRVKEQTTKFATRLQRKLNFNETQIRVDGNIRSDIQPTGDFVNHGAAIISFPYVR